MFTARAVIDIEAPPPVVWKVLTDLERWSEWSTWLAHEGGTPEVGAHLKLKLTPPGGGGWSFSPEVLALDDCQRFAWVGRTGIAGVFDGEHHFELEAIPSGTRLINRERYSGILSPIFQRLPQMQGLDEGFEAMNLEVKERAEALARER